MRNLVGSNGDFPIPIESVPGVRLGVARARGRKIGIGVQGTIFFLLRLCLVRCSLFSPLWPI